MELPVLSGIIERRILINYRVDPDVIRKILPYPLKPIIIGGYASAGICLLKLRDIGLKYSPKFLKINSENAAHRVLVQWREGEQVRCGVYIPRRDTDSLLNVWLAGKVFAWPHYPAQFQTEEDNENYFVSVRSSDHRTSVLVRAKVGSTFPSSSMFRSIEHASECFQECSWGYSPSMEPGHYKQIQLKTTGWAVKPLDIQELSSNFFEDETIFPKRSVTFDNALLMENIPHEWHSIPT
jgi:uncharacterized protein YqjF (DUF2071 family)